MLPLFSTDFFTNDNDMNYFSKKEIASASGMHTVTIGPTLAEFWFSLNSPNRDVSKQFVDEYARRMQEGKWVHNGESLKFNKKGLLIDGQTRLLAIMKSGANIVSDVRFGLEIDAKDTLDEGRKRQADGSFKMHGVSNYTNAAAICRGVMSWQRGSKVKAVLLMNQEVFEFYSKNPIIQEIATISAAHYMACRKTISRSEIGVLMFLFQEIHSLKMADDFFHDIANGYSDRTTCVKLLVDRLILDKISNTRKMPAEVKRALIIKAWNNWVKRSNLKQLKYSIGEEFPKIQ
jgi:hypothetical protein